MTERAKPFADEMVTIGGAPWGESVPALTSGGTKVDAHLSGLRRPPVMKTFRARDVLGEFTFRAESREAALAKLAESLEEVP